MKTLKTIAPLVLALAAAIPPARAADSNPPERMTYQGFLVDGNGSALATNAPKNYDVVFRIWNDQTSTAPANRLWTEQQTVTVDKGYFSVLLGEGASIGEARPALSTVFNGADASDRFIGITVLGIGAGGANVDILPRLRMLTSPYSYLARNSVNAANLVNSTNAQIVTLFGNNVGIGRAVPTTALDVNGTVKATAFSGALAATDLTGTIADARLSANVALLNSNQTFTARPVLANGAVLNDKSIFLRGSSDTNHAVGYGYGFAGLSIDGPALYGYGGGLLGTTVGGQKAVLTWNNAGQVGIGKAQPSADLDVGGYNANGSIRTVFARLSEGDGSGSGTWLGVTAWGSQTTSYSGKMFSIEHNFYGLLNSSIDFYRGGNATGGYIAFRTYNGSAAGYIDTGGFHSTSDGRLKKDIAEETGVLDKVLKLRPVSYRLKNGPEDARKHLGFIAQELEPLFPEVVTEFNGVKTVAYSELISVSVAAIQELHAEVQGKDAEVEKLKSEVSQLRALVEQLVKARGDGEQK